MYVETGVVRDLKSRALRHYSVKRETISASEHIPARKLATLTGLDICLETPTTLELKCSLTDGQTTDHAFYISIQQVSMRTAFEENERFATNLCYCDAAVLIDENLFMEVFQETTPPIGLVGHTPKIR